MSFRHENTSPVKPIDIDAEIYHYGWVKPPDTMMLKRINFHKLYHADEEMLNISESSFKFDDFGNLKKFEGSHPKLMTERIEMSNWNFDAKIPAISAEAERLGLPRRLEDATRRLREARDPSYVEFLRGSTGAEPAIPDPQPATACTARSAEG